MNITTNHFDQYGYFIGKFPEECIADCSAQGAVDDCVEYWQQKLGFEIPRKLAIKWLRGFGAWDKDELEAESDSTLARRVLWLACCDIKENGEWFGLTD